MPRRKLTAAHYTAKNGTLVPLILGDMIEPLGRAVRNRPARLRPCVAATWIGRSSMW
jgi:hypothetical protein